MLRMPRARTLASSLAAAFLLLAATGCENMQKRDWGTAIGGIVGAAAGYKIGDDSAGGAAIGALLGSVVGRMIGQYMDDADRSRLVRTIMAEVPSMFTLGSGSPTRLISTPRSSATGEYTESASTTTCSAASGAVSGSGSIR